MRLSLYENQQRWLSPSDDASTRLYLLRHGEVEAAWHQTMYGQMDVPLSEFGMLQSQATGQHLSHHPLHAVYSSDLARAAYLSEEIARHHGIKPRLSNHLRERKFGDWQGVTFHEVESGNSPEYRRYLDDRFTVRAPGDSENFVDVRDRVLPFLKETIERHPGESIAITCHSGPARMILGACLMLPLDGLFSFDQDYCCLNVIDIHPSGRVRVKHVNQIHHLDHLVRP
jgi:alpha-ribazole phosphatase